MKKLILVFSFLIFSCNILKGVTLIEHVIPQYFGCKSDNSGNNCRTPFAVCLQINGLLPYSSYELTIGVALLEEYMTINGAGNVWNGTSFSGQILNNLISTDGMGNSSPFWCYIQPTGNSGRFDAGQVHDLRIFYRNPPDPYTLTNYLRSTKTIIALDIPVIARTPSTLDDGAFFKAYNLCNSGKFALIYNNTAGTGDPLSAYQIRNCIATNPSQTGLPVLINEFFSQSGSSSKGDFAGTIPIGANNPYGVRRLEIRNPDNSLYYALTDADGIWPDGTNTTTLARRDVANAILNFCYIYVLHFQYRWNNILNYELPDTVMIGLRNENPPFDVRDISISKFDSSGEGEFNFSNVTDSVNYFITVKHRNSIETWSSESHKFINATMNYNFSRAITQAYGNNMIQIDTSPVLFGIYGGDVNQDGLVNSSDILQTYNDGNEFVSGYVVTDINGDNLTDLNDVLSTYNNSAKFVSMIRP